MLIKYANLPKNPVNTVVIGDKYYELLKNGLNKYGIERIITLKECEILSEEVEGHADMLSCHLGTDNFFISKKTILNGNLLELGINIIKTESPEGKEYPNDVGLNALIIGKKLVHNLKYTDTKLLEKAREMGYELINVKQGYCKCAVCVVDENSVITADNGMAKTLSAHGIECLVIEPGEIMLSGRERGFIGGSSVKLSNNVMAFTGKFINKNQQEAVENFLHSKSIKSVFLTEEQIFDVGSIIPLIQRGNTEGST